MLRSLLQIGTQIILARLLGPSEYGIFAIVLIVQGFSRFFSDIGISYGLIQKKTITDRDIKFVFTWQVILGAGVALAVFFLAGPLAGFFREASVVPVIQVTSVICLINALASPSANLLKRDLDFKSLQSVQLISYVFGYIVIGIPMALAGKQAWALIFAFIGTETMCLILLYRRCRHPVGLVFWLQDNHLIVYGSRVFITNALNWLISNIDRVIIGRAFPAAQIGLYSLSYNLVSSPAQTIIGAIQSALFSTSAQAQDDFVRLRKALLTVIGAVTLLLFPVFIGISVASETVLQSLYGDAWLSASGVLQAIALAMPLYIVLGMTTPLLWVAGQTQKEFMVQVPIAIAFVFAALLASLSSLDVVAWVVFAMYLARMVTILTVTCRALDIGARQMLGVMKGGVVTTMASAGAIAAVDFLARGMTSYPAAWLGADIAAGALGLLLPLWLFPGLIHVHVAQLFEKIALRLPSPTRSWLQSLLYRGQLKSELERST